MDLKEIPATGLRRTRLTAALALLLAISLAAFLVRGVIEVQESIGDIRKNDIARTQIRGVLIDLIDAETGQRGYLLTGDENYLMPYQRGRMHIQELIRDPKRLGDLHEQLGADSDEIVRLAQGKLEELGRTIALVRGNKTDAARNVVKQGYGKAVMDRSRRLIELNLERLRRERDVILDDLHVRFWRAGVFLLGTLLAICGLAAYTWKRLSGAVRDNNRLAKRLSREAMHDALTGLPNRRFFDKWADYLVKKSNRERRPFMLMLVDLDGFKKVNDTLGHAAGDDVLQQAAARLQKALRGNELLARLGGDEFGVLIEGNLSHVELTSLGNRLIASLRPALGDGMADGAVGASIGVAHHPDNGSDIESLKAAADAALYESKSNGRGRISFAPRRLVGRADGAAALKARLE
jgi:diguanylate cyclase (GGDEF)-like protein